MRNNLMSFLRVEVGFGYTVFYQQQAIIEYTTTLRPSSLSSWQRYIFDCKRTEPQIYKWTHQICTGIL